MTFARFREPSRAEPSRNAGKVVGGVRHSFDGRPFGGARIRRGRILPFGRFVETRSCSSFEQWTTAGVTWRVCAQTQEARAREILSECCSSAGVGSLS